MLAVLLFILRNPLLSFDHLSASTLAYADELIVLFYGIMVGMSCQMPVSSGIFRGSGDVRFVIFMNLLSVWFIVMPLSFLSAFVWRSPLLAVAAIIQSDQVFKCLPTYLRFRS